MPKLSELCQAIKVYEGFFGPGVDPDYPNGSPSFRNNNPGNCRYNPSGYRSIYGEVKRSATGFAVFPTYDLGMLYLENLLKGKIEQFPSYTFLQFFSGVPADHWPGYAPVSDGNDPVKYAAFVEHELGVGPDFIIGNLIV